MIIKSLNRSIKAYGIEVSVYRQPSRQPAWSAWNFHYCHYFTFLHHLSDFYGEVFDKVVFC